MNDTAAPGAAPWVDPELVAAGKLLQEKGLVAPDRTVASLAEVRAATGPHRRVSRRGVGAAGTTSATCRCPARTARCRAGSICRTT